MNRDKTKYNFFKFKLLIKKPVISWALYDFANNAFAIVIVTVVFPVYFTSVIAAESIYGQQYGVLIWGIASGLSMFIAAICAPVFGAIADTKKLKNRFLTVLTLLCITCCVLLFFTNAGMIVFATAIFIFANFFYQTSIVFYNSFLPEISCSKNFGLISGFGFALGYLGGLITLAIIYPFVKNSAGISSTLSVRLTFIITAVFFLVFSLPSFIFLKDKRYNLKPEILENSRTIKSSNIRHSFSQLRQTFIKIKEDKNLLKFLLAFFLFSNAFSILAVYAAIYGKNILNLSLQEIVLLFIIGHFPVIISSFFFGAIADRFGPRRVIISTLIVWCVVIILIVSSELKLVFYIAFMLASVVTGSTLIASRSLMSFLTPVGREAEYFSFYSIGGKMSSILGPVFFALIAYFTKSERIALLSTIIFLIGGLLIVYTVKVPEERVKA